MAQVAALSAMEEPAAWSGGLAAASAAAAAASPRAPPVMGAEVTPSELASWLSFPAEWGPSEWGPIPFLPDPDSLLRSMERNWGPLSSFSGLRSFFPASSRDAPGPRLLVAGLQLGNLWIGVGPRNPPVRPPSVPPVRLSVTSPCASVPLPLRPAALAASSIPLPTPRCAGAASAGDGGRPHAATIRTRPDPAPAGRAQCHASLRHAASAQPNPSSWTRPPRPPQYAAAYKWLQHGYRADAVVHFGMHGTVEWLPGSPLGNTGLSWSEALMGDLPNVYVYAANNPSESIIAKRRGYGTIVSHNVPPYGRAGLYKQLFELQARRAALRVLLAVFLVTGTFHPAPPSQALLRESRESPSDEAAAPLRAPIAALLEASGLWKDVPLRHFPSAGARGNGNGIGAASSDRGAAADRAMSVEEAEAMPADAWAEYCSRVYNYLGVLEQRLFSSGLHTLGLAPSPAQAAAYLAAYFGATLPAAAVDAIAAGAGTAAARAALEASRAAAAPGTQLVAEGAAAEAALAEAETIAQLLGRTGEELDGVVRALRGEYVLPAPGGDLLRDGPGVLPTGRNIHALDPYRMPSPAAAARGAAAAAGVLAAHAAAAGGGYPETVSINLWGLDAIKTKGAVPGIVVAASPAGAPAAVTDHLCLLSAGESVGTVLALVGAVPVKEATGRVARFELLPLEQLGRPRIDCLCNMSGIFRDSFANVVALLDDLFARAAAADEPDEMNFVRKHARAMAAAGLEAPTARLFSNPAGDYGSMVNERVGAGSWEQGDELGETWVSRNAYSYGARGERGAARPEVLRALLATTERVVQAVDSVEYGLTDIQEYYANTGKSIPFGWYTIPYWVWDIPVGNCALLLPFSLTGAMFLGRCIAQRGARREARPRPCGQRRRGGLLRGGGVCAGGHGAAGAGGDAAAGVPIEAAKPEVGGGDGGAGRRRRVRDQPAHDGGGGVGRHLWVLRGLGLGRGLRHVRGRRRHGGAAAARQPAGVCQRGAPHAGSLRPRHVGRGRRHAGAAAGALRRAGRAAGGRGRAADACAARRGCCRRGGGEHAAPAVTRPPACAGGDAGGDEAPRGAPVPVL